MSYNMMKVALDASSIRQELISSNISNVNTPDYKTSRLDFEGYLNRALYNGNLSRTQARHMDDMDTNSFIINEGNTYVQDNGNNVDIDYEMAELSANKLYYDSVVTELNNRYAMIRSVLK